MRGVRCVRVTYCSPGGQPGGLLVETLEGVLTRRTIGWDMGTCLPEEWIRDPYSHPRAHGGEIRHPPSNSVIRVCKKWKN